MGEGDVAAPLGQTGSERVRGAGVVSPGVDTGPLRAWGRVREGEIAPRCPLLRCEAVGAVLGSACPVGLPKGMGGMKK